MASDIAERLDVQIEPFDPGHHDRAAFSSGSRNIDNFLKITAKKQQKDDFTRIWVAVRAKSPAVLGYYAINSHALVIEDLPAFLKKRTPNHDRVGAAYLSMFGVDASAQGRGLGRLLFADALKRIGRISEEIGIFAVVLDVLTDGDAKTIAKRTRFYEDFGFLKFPSSETRMFLLTKTIRVALNAASSRFGP